MITKNLKMSDFIPYNLETLKEKSKKCKFIDISNRHHQNEDSLPRNR